MLWLISIFADNVNPFDGLPERQVAPIIDHLVHATGSAGMQAGLVTALAELNSGIPLLGIGVRAPEDKQEANVFVLAEKTAAYLGLPDVVKRDCLQLNFTPSRKSRITTVLTHPGICGRRSGRSIERRWTTHIEDW